MTATKVALSDTLVSLLAGIAVFPVVFSFGMQPVGGPGLLFVTIPLAFSKMPFGVVLLTAFFILAAMAATMAMLSLVEVLVAFLSEELKLKRSYAVLSVCFTIFLVGALTVHPQSLFAGVSIFGKSLFDFFDYTSSNIFLPVGGFLIVLFVAYFRKKGEVISEITNEGTVNKKLAKFLYPILKYVSPVLMVIVLLSSLGVL